MYLAGGVDCGFVSHRDPGADCAANAGTLDWCDLSWRAGLCRLLHGCGDSFFAFAHALNKGAHIRVSIVLNVLGRTGRRVVETWCFAIGAALAWYITWYAVKMAYWSWKFKDVSQGQDVTPLWIPQSAMVIGSVLFAIALTDHLIHLLFAGNHRIDADIVEQSHGGIAVMEEIQPNHSVPVCPVSPAWLRRLGRIGLDGRLPMWEWNCSLPGHREMQC